LCNPPGYWLSVRGAKRRSNLRFGDRHAPPGLAMTGKVLLRGAKLRSYLLVGEIASLAMTDMSPEFESCDLVLRHAHDQMHGGAELVGELRAVNGDRRILAVGPERAQQRPSPPWFQRRLNDPLNQLRDYISDRSHPRGVD